eukprot:10113888-Lingulodinium_polyedra.AAC.1
MKVDGHALPDPPVNGLEVNTVPVALLGVEQVLDRVLIGGMGTPSLLPWRRAPGRDPSGWLHRQSGEKNSIPGGGGPVVCVHPRD